MFEEHQASCPDGPDGKMHMGLWLEFDVDESEGEDDYRVASAVVQHHTHYVPPVECAAALISSAFQLLLDSAEGSFENAPEHVMRSVVGDAMRDIFEKTMSGEGVAFVTIPEDVGDLD